MFTLSSFTPLWRALIVWYNVCECNCSSLFIPACAILVLYDTAKRQCSHHFITSMKGGISWEWKLLVPLVSPLLSADGQQAWQSPQAEPENLLQQETSDGKATPSAKPAFGGILPPMFSQPYFSLPLFTMPALARLCSLRLPPYTWQWTLVLHLE